MSHRFVNIDRRTPLLLPVDLRDWVPAEHLIHFIIDAVDCLDLSAAKINQRGTGSEQYPPALMLALLIYSYATGTFSSRRIEALTYDAVAVRYLCADRHPDHDSICAFRRNNKDLLSSSFHQVLELAATAKILKFGQITVSIDGTKILANASRHNANSHAHTVEHIQLASKEIEQLLAKAEDADSTPLKDGLTIPAEVRRREDRIARLQEAKTVMEARSKQRLAEETSAHEAKLAARAEREKATGRKPSGRSPRPPEDAGPKPTDQYNHTDPESRIMPHRGGFEQCYNAQAAVDVDTMLIVAAHVCTDANDKKQLLPTARVISPCVGPVSNVLIDSGFYSEEAVASVENSGAGPTVYAAVDRSHHGRTVKQLEQHPDPAEPAATAPAIEHMRHRTRTEAGRKLYGLRKQTVEPVFGIIKHVMGFRRFLLRGRAKVNLEWTLVTLSYNLKRLHRLGLRPACA
jgi:transposase